MRHIEGVLAAIVNDFETVALSSPGLDKALEEEKMRLATMKNKKGECLFPNEIQQQRLALINLGLRKRRSTPAADISDVISAPGAE